LQPEAAPAFSTFQPEAAPGFPPEKSIPPHCRTLTVLIIQVRRRDCRIGKQVRANREKREELDDVVFDGKLDCNEQGRYIE
jgi:hypothetical protein